MLSPDGDFLRTRNFGVMEMDDSYGSRAATVSKELPKGLTCIRLCDWTDKPCGLYVEMCKDRISNHILNWHGVSAHAKVPCKFQGCADTSAMNNLGRHIETVHYSTTWQCCYCHQLLSRSDAVARHQKGCQLLGRAKRLAAQEGRKFNLQSAKKVLTGQWLHFSCSGRQVENCANIYVRPPYPFKCFELSCFCEAWDFDNNESSPLTSSNSGKRIRIKLLEAGLPSRVTTSRSSSIYCAMQV